MHIYKFLNNLKIHTTLIWFSMIQLYYILFIMSKTNLKILGNDN